MINEYISKLDALKKGYAKGLNMENITQILRDRIYFELTNNNNSFDKQ